MQMRMGGLIQYVLLYIAVSILQGLFCLRLRYS